MAFDKPRPKRRQARSDFYITDKAIMGGYFNLAQLNFFKTLMEIFTKAGIDVSKIKQDNSPKYLMILIKKLTHDDEKIDDKKWADALDLSNECLLKLQQLLYKHFPFLGPVMGGEASYNIYKLKDGHPEVKVANDVMRGVKLEDCLAVVRHFALCLNDCRNFYTHFNPYNPIEAQKEQYLSQNKVAVWLDKVKDASRRIIKQNNQLTSQDMEFLTGIDRMKPQDKVDDFGNIMTDRRGRPIKEYVEYEDYYFRIRGKRYLVDAAGAKLVDQEPRNALSDFGVVFLCTLFLESDQARRMLDELRLFETGPYDGSRDGDEFKNDILREILLFYRTRVPRGKRLDPMDDTTLLAMDMLNELRKCPMPLYDVLSREGQGFFEDEVKRPNDLTPEVAKRLRSSDRFPYLALRYIDLNKCFDNIRFQVQLGKFRYKFYDKTTIDGEQVVRGLQKEVNAYGRLQDVEHYRQEKYADMLQQTELVETGEEDITIANFIPDTPQSSSYLSDRTASYNIHNNRIGLFWNMPGEQEVLAGDEKMYLPDLNVDDNGKADVFLPAPKASLSVRDLPALVFYLYLQNQHPDLTPAEAIIQQKYNALVSFFEDVSTGRLLPVKDIAELEAAIDKYGHLTVHEIPEKLRDYLTGVAGTEDDDDCADRLDCYAMGILEKRYRRVAAHIDQLKEARKMVGDKMNRYGKKSYIDVRPRRLAEQLAQSIVDWQPATDNGRHKMTGKNFQRLIAFLARYTDEVPVQEIKDLMTRARLLDGPVAHPFLQQVLDKNPLNIEVLYDLYFKEEKLHLENYLEIETNKQGEEVFRKKASVDLSRIPFLNSGRLRFHKRDSASFQRLAARYMQVDGRQSTILLPDGLFTPHILSVLKSEYRDLQDHLQDQELNRNASYLMSVYLECVLHDSAQPFYLSNSNDSPFARRYDLFAILQNKKKGAELLPNPLAPVEINRRLTAKTPDGSAKLIERDIKALLDDMARKTEERIHDLQQEYSRKKEKQAQEERVKLERCFMRKIADVKKQAQEERINLQRRLKHKITDVKKNERTIRRYKTQDMAVFLMAKQMLANQLSWQNQEGEVPFKLANVCNEGFLRQTMKVSFPYEVPLKEDKTKKVTIDIVQDNMSLKNYGLLYKLYHDERVVTLLQNIVDQQQISFAELTAELSLYDQNRSKAFSNFQQFEKLAFETNKEALTHPEHRGFFLEKVNKKNQVIRYERRNNFDALLDLLDAIEAHQLDPRERQWLTSVRNAFCHNSYYKIDMQQIEKKLPTIIQQIVEIVQRITDKASHPSNR